MPISDFRRTSAEAALRLMFDACERDRPFTLFDVRDAHSYSHGHIPNATQLNEHEVATWVDQLPPTQLVLIYCSRGFSSQSFAKRFADRGFEEVYSVDGGFPELVRAFEQARQAAFASAAASPAE